MSRESEAIRRAIREGVIDKEKDRDEWERSVDRVYQIEREEEKNGQTQVLTVS